MSGFCGCFKSSQQVTNNNAPQRRGKHKNSIVKNKEMDLLDMNKRGIVDGGEEDGQWLDVDHNQTGDERLLHQQSDMTAEQNGLRLTTSNYEETKLYEDNSQEKAIDDFMQSPKIVSRKIHHSHARSAGTLAEYCTKSQQNKVHQLGLASNGVGLSGNTVTSSSVKKTGVCVSKCYQMLCGRCGRRFAKIMILELTADSENQTAFEIQSYFNGTQNHDYECPFCYQKAQIILSEQMLVGDAQQLDYQKTLDKASPQDRMRLVQQLSNTSRNKTPDSGASENSPQQQDSQQHPLGSGGEDTAAALVMEARPQQLYTKFQRLKNTTKLAKVILVDEMPIAKGAPTQQNMQNQQSSNNMFQPSMMAGSGEAAIAQQKSNNSGETAVSVQQQQNINAITGSAQNGQQIQQPALDNSQFDKYHSSKNLLYYPEENHVPNESACQTFNSRIMRHLMKQKMQKNDTFYTSKVLKGGDNHFLQRMPDKGGGGGEPIHAIRRESRKNMQTSNSQSALIKSAGQKQHKVNLSTDQALHGGVRPQTSNLEQSRYVNNHDSTVAQDVELFNGPGFGNPAKK